MDQKTTPQGTARGWLVVLAASLIMFMPTYAQMQMAPIAGSLMATYGISDAQYMSVFTAPNLPPVFLAFIAGILLDRFGTKKTVLVAGLFTVAGCIARVLVVGYVPFYCSCILIGVATSFIVTGTTKIVAGFFPMEKVGLPVGIVFAAANVANLIAASTTAYFDTTTTAFTVSAAVAAISVLAWAFLVPADKGATTDEAAAPQESLGSLLKNVLTCKDYWLTLIAYTLFGVLGFTIAGILPTALAERGMSTTDAGLMAAVYSLGSLLGCVVMPLLLPRVKSEKAFLVIVSGVLIVLFPLIAVCPIGIAMGVLLAVVGLASYGLVPILMSLPIRFEKVGIARAGTAGGVMTMIQSLCVAMLPGNVIIPLAGGDYSTVFVILGVLCAIAMVCAIGMKVPKPMAPPIGDMDI